MQLFSHMMPLYIKTIEKYIANSSTSYLKAIFAPRENQLSAKKAEIAKSFLDAITKFGLGVSKSQSFQDSEYDSEDEYKLRINTARLSAVTFSPLHRRAKSFDCTATSTIVPWAISKDKGSQDSASGQSYCAARLKELKDIEANSVKTESASNTPGVLIEPKALTDVAIDAVSLIASTITGTKALTEEFEIFSSATAEHYNSIMEKMLVAIERSRSDVNKLRENEYDGHPKGSYEDLLKVIKLNILYIQNHERQLNIRHSFQVKDLSAAEQTDCYMHKARLLVFIEQYLCALHFDKTLYECKHAKNYKKNLFSLSTGFNENTRSEYLKIEDELKAISYGIFNKAYSADVTYIKILFDIDKLISIFTKPGIPVSYVNTLKEYRNELELDFKDRFPFVASLDEVAEKHRANFGSIMIERIESRDKPSKLSLL